MRYRMKVQQNDLTWRLGVENVTNGENTGPEWKTTGPIFIRATRES